MSLQGWDLQKEHLSFNLIFSYWNHFQGVREKARVFETLNFFGKGLTQIETDVQLL